MIFVTVGTWRFDELVKVVDQAVGHGCLDGEIVIQIGGSEYEPKHCEYFRSATTLASYYDRADLVVSHGGATTFEVLSRGLRLISVANPHVQDNHQHIFLEALEGRGYVTYCRDLTKLPELIRCCHSSVVPVALKTLPWLPIATELERATLSGSSFQKLQPWALRGLKKIRIREKAVDLVTTALPLHQKSRP